MAAAADFFPSPGGWLAAGKDKTARPKKRDRDKLQDAVRKGDARDDGGTAEKAKPDSGKPPLYAAY